MARTDTFVGLNDRAKALVAQAKQEKSETLEGAFFNYFELSKYTMPDGRVLFERVHQDPWASGPYFFTALQFASGEWVTVSLWTDQEICDYLGWPHQPMSAPEETAPPPI